MKKISTLLFLLAVSSTLILNAQTFEVTGCSAPLGSNLYGPMHSVVTANATNRTAVIYPASQLSGIVGAPITSVYFNRVSTTGSMAGTPNFKIYLKEVAASDWGTTALDWATASAGATLVFNGNPASIVGSTAGWKSFPTSAAFTFSGSQNLAVFTEYNNPTASASITWLYEYTAPCITTTNSNTTKYSNVTTGIYPTSLSSSNYRRPYIGFDLALSCFAPTDVVVSNVTQTSATISWTAPSAPPANGYDYYYSTSNTTPISSTTPSGSTAPGITTANITGLTAGTTYYAYIRSVCGAGDKSPWTSAKVFGTSPSNDDCGNAISLTQNASCTNTAGSTVGGTLSMAATPCFGTPDDDVWFSFVATSADASIALSNVVAMVGSSTDMYFQVLSGSCGSLTSLLCSDPNTGIVGGLVVGQTYYIRVYTYSTTSQASFDICVTPVSVAPTTCPTLTAPTTGSVVSVTPTLTWGSVTNATSYDIYLDQSTPPGTVYATVSNATSYTVSPLLAPGTYYWYVVAKNSAGAFTSCTANTRSFIVVDPPANDDCASATSITTQPNNPTCTSNIPASTSGATASTITETSCVTTSDNDDIFYTFTATTTSHLLLFSGMVATSGTATTLGYHIFTGSCGGLTQLTSCSSGFGTAGAGSTIITGLTVGTVYYLQLFTGGTGNSADFNFCLQDVVPPPANDDCAGAISITTQPIGTVCSSTVAASTSGATSSTVPETSCSTTSDNDDIFYTFTATSNSQILRYSNLVATLGTATTLGYHVFSGTCAGLTQLTSCDVSFGTGGAGSIQINGLTIGQIYYLKLFTAGTNNSGTFNFCLQDAPTPPNDECSGAVSMPVTTFGSPCIYTTVATTGATMSTVTGQTNTCTSTGIDDDVFYTFTTTFAGVYTFSYTGLTATSGTASTVGQNVYTGSCGALTPVTSACSSGYGSGGTGSTTLTLAASTTYTLRLSVGSSPNTGTFNFCITAPAPPPANDNCGGAISLPTPSATATCTNAITGTTLGATQSTDAAPSCSATGINDDVFYSFVATATTHTVLLTNETNPTAAAIYSGSCGSLTQLVNACGTGGTSASGLTIGATYFVRVYTTSTTVGTTSNFDICVVSGAPANDDCAGAISLTASTTSTCINPVPGTTVGASQSPDAAPTCSATGINDDVFYSFVATSTSHSVLITNATNTTAAAIYSGSCGSLIFITNACGSGSTGSAQATALTIGSTYFIRVYTTSATAGTYSNFDICVISNPSNDNCSGAQPLTVSTGNSCSAATPGSTLGATASTETAPTCSATGTNDDVFYSFVATSTTHTVALENTSTTMAAAVYSGNCGALVQIANACGSTNTVASGLTIGSTYYVRVFSTSTTVGTYGTFEICIGVLPTNDDCAGAISLTASADATCNSVSGSTVGSTATTSETAPTCSATGANDDVFYSFVAVATTQIVSLIDPSTTTAVQVYGGSCGSLVAITCASTTTTATGLTIGATYYLRVYSTSTTAGTFSNFDICVTGPPANDECPQAITLTNGVVVNGSTVGATQTLAPSLCSGSTASAALDVFYQFVPAQNGTATILLSNPSSVFDGVIEVLSGSCGALTSLSCIDLTANGVNETLIVNGLISGTTYYIRVYDYSGTGTFSISYSQINSAPVVTASAGNTSFTEGTPVVVDGGITVTDADNPNLVSATVSITGGFQSTEDVLVFTNQNGITGIYNAATGILSLAGSSSVANYQAALRSIQYNNTSLSPNTADRTISFQVHDGTTNSNVSTKTITITAVNNAPVVTASGGNTGYVSGTPVLVDGAITVTDADNINLTSATVSITDGFQSTEDVLVFTNQNGITGTYNAATGILSLTGSSSVANYQMALQSVQYNNTSLTPNTTNRTISFQVNDGTTNSNISTKTVTLTAINNAPVVTASAGTTAFTEGSPVAVDGAITVSDIDNADLVSATVRITGGFQSTEDLLVFTNQSGITGTYNAATGILTLTGTSSVANYQTALQSVQYNNTSSNPNTGNRTISFQVNDGTTNSNITTKVVTITAVNNAPVVTASAANTGYTSGTPVVVDGAITVTDADNANLVSGTVSITGGFQSTEDVLVFTNQNGITGTYNGATGILSLTGVSSVANYQTALQSVRYNNTSLTPNTTNRTISFQVNDGTTNSNISTKTVTLTAVNNAPVVTASGGNTGYTSGTPVVVDGGITVTDIDNTNLVSGTVSITGGFQSSQDVLLFTNQNGITGVYNAATGVLTLTGASSVSNYQAALRSVRYNNISLTPNTTNRTVSFQVNDGTINSNTSTKTITITAVNNAPVVTASAGNTAYTEGTSVAADGGITVTDLDNANLVSATVSITGGFQSTEDVLVFTNQNGITGTYNAATGVLTLTGSSSVANYQAALRSVQYNNTSVNPNTANRTISFQVNDGATNSNVATKTVTITAINNAPVVSASPGNTSFTEGTPAAIDGGITVTDVDNVNLVSGTVSITGGFRSTEDVLLFINQNGITGVYNAVTGVLTLTGSSSVANYQAALRSVQYDNTSSNPNTANRTISFQVNDGTTNSNVSTKTVSITATNNAPVVTASAGNTAFTEGTPVAIDGGITVTDVDNANLVSGTVSITGGFQSTEDMLVFNNQNGITGVYNAASGVLTLTGSSSVANYQTALRGMQYNNTSSTPNLTNRIISFQVNDGTTNSNISTKTVTITAVNNAPVVTSSTGNTGFTSGTPVVIDGAITITDADNANLISATVSITGGFQSTQDLLVFTNQNGIAGTYNAATGVLTLSGSSTVANYQAALRSVQYNNTSLTPNTANRIISFQVNDGTTNSNVATKTITITAVNNAPVVTTSGGNTSFTEGTPVVVDGGITVTDIDNANLVSATVSITGGFQSTQDQLVFANQNFINGTYNAATGILTLTGSSSLANYQTALRSVRYNNTALNPNTANRTISFQVNDGTANSNIATKTVTVTAVTNYLTLYPNPARKEVTILSSRQIISVDIIDVEGRVVKRMEGQLNNRYNILDLRPGIYFVRVTDTEKTETITMLKQ